MKKYFAAYLSIAIVMVVLDFIWLAIIAKPIYQSGIGHLMAPEPNLLFAGLFYMVYVLALIIFSIKPYASSPGLRKTTIAAAIFGFFVYASYDLTNLAVLKNWPINLALIGLAWGIFISSISATIGKFVLDRFAKIRYF
ncbi:MAG TPA: DUF2177 family protein [Methylotenera sp.]|nr:DUF2177 family protein [Methylotenera sp.]